MIYGNSILEGAGVILDESTYDECVYEAGIEGAMNIVAESEYNWQKLMEATGIDELQYFVENGTEMVYEASGTGFFAKAKDFFKKVWEKVKGLFRKFFGMFDAMVKDDAAFLSKYKTKLTRVDIPSDFKIKGYHFTIDQKPEIVQPDNSTISTIVTNITTDNQGKLDEYDSDDINEQIRGIVLGDKGKYTDKEFSTALFENLRNGESDKEDIENITVGQIVSALGSTKQLRKEAEKNFKDIKRTIESSIKTCEQAEKKALNGTDDTDTKSLNISKEHRKIEVYRMLLNADQVANGATLTAIKQYGQQWKMTAAKLLKYVHESVEEDGDVVSESHISNVDFI